MIGKGKINSLTAAKGYTLVIFPDLLEKTALECGMNEEFSFQ